MKENGEERLTECVLSRTANLFLATQTDVRPEERLPSGADNQTTTKNISFTLSAFFSSSITDTKTHMMKSSLSSLSLHLFLCVCLSLLRSLPHSLSLCVSLSLLHSIPPCPSVSASLQPSSPNQLHYQTQRYISHHNLNQNICTSQLFCHLT